MKRMNRNTMLSVLMLAMFAVAITATFAVAAPNAPTALTQVSSSTRDLTGLPAQSIGAQGGNVTQVNIATLTITKSWQGYYGNITGSITLQDASNFTFYNWTLTKFNGRVFASRSNSISWTKINCTNATNRTSEETYLGQSASDSDSVSNTFGGTTHPSFTVGAITIAANSCFSTNGFVNNNSQSSNFTMVLLSPNDTGVVVYTALMNHSVVGFDGNQHDFELLVGENEKTGNLGSTPYFFWTEFS